MKLINFIGIFVVFTALNSEAIPQYSCNGTETICTFYDIQLNSTHYDWEPVSNNPSAVYYVQISHSNIPVLTSNICDTFSKITRFDIYENNVEIVQADAFMDCTRLETLALGTNKIKSIAKRTFYYNTAIKKLELFGNQITYFVDNSVFENMVNLEYFTLDNNKLTEFSPELIRYNKKLTTLGLRANYLKDFTVEKIYEYVPDIKFIDLKDNEIPCSRVIEILTFCEKKNISCHISCGNILNI